MITWVMTGSHKNKDKSFRRAMELLRGYLVVFMIKESILCTPCKLEHQLVYNSLGSSDCATFAF